MAESRPGAIVAGMGFGVLTHLRGVHAAGFEAVAIVGRDPQKTAQRAATTATSAARPVKRGCIGRISTRNCTSTALNEKTT